MIKKQADHVKNLNKISEIWVLRLFKPNSNRDRQQQIESEDQVVNKESIILHGGDDFYIIFNN